MPSRQLGVGACATPTSPSEGYGGYGTSGFLTPKELCGMNKIGSALLNLAGVSNGVIVVVPTTSQWFCPCGVRMVVTANGNPDVNHRAKIFAIMINQIRQECTNNTAPVAGSTDFSWSDDYTAPDGCACPVRWGCMSVAALVYDGQITVRNEYAAGIAIDTQISLWGTCHNSVPPGLVAGEPRPSSAPPPQ